MLAVELPVGDAVELPVGETVNHSVDDAVEFPIGQGIGDAVGVPVVLAVELTVDDVVGEAVELTVVEDPVYIIDSRARLEIPKKKYGRVPEDVTELLCASTNNDNANTIKEMKMSLFIVRFSFWIERK